MIEHRELQKMMMSKPALESTSDAPDVKKKNARAAVEDLERRLAMLSAADKPKIDPPTVAKTPSLRPQVVAPPVTAKASAPAAVKGGKNALLARIMAAKERSQLGQAKSEPAKQEPSDLLMDFDAPSTEKDPPPAYNTNFLQPPPLPAAPPAYTQAPTRAELPPPPAFDIFQNQVKPINFLPPPPIESAPQMNFPPPPPIESVLPPPPIESVLPPTAPAASAPSFEDLLESEQTTHNHLATVQAVPPPPAIDEDILAALDPAEREALLEEQKKIMEQIEREKASNDASSAAARAMAFDQRSSSAVARVAASMDNPRSTQTRPTTSASSQSRQNQGGATVDLGSGEQVPLHGQERTQQAIKEGTALVVQCINCQNWMQVTNSASLMFCPVCQVVSPVEKAGAASAADMEDAAQLAADAALAEKLQNEEYNRASGEERRPRRKTQHTQSNGEGQSWYDWFTGVPTSKPTTNSTRPNESRPQATPVGLVAAQTGEELGGSRSYNESEGGGGARVAEQKSMFACVTDSISTAANQMTAYTLSDQDGNVHGVDSSSLLAMPDVSRQRENQ